MSGIRSFSLIVLAVALATSTVRAQPTGAVPRVVRFDGVIGAPAPAGPNTVRLAIYDAAEAGLLLWDETQVVPVDALGRYSVLVGAGRPEGLPPEVLASTAPRWLEVRFSDQPAPSTRVLLTSVPYALRAADADTLGGLPASAFLRAPEGTTDAEAGDSARTAGPGPRVSTGTANYIGKFTSAVDLTSSVMFENGGRIGLGNTSPSDSLHVTLNDGSGSVTGYAVQNLSGSANAYSGMLFYDQNGALGQFQGFNNTTHEYRINNIASGGTINFMLGGLSRFRVRNDGDVDIAASIRQGGALFVHNRGTDNTAVGLNALPSGTPGGGSNVAFGANALAALGSFAQSNVAIGIRSLTSATNGSENVAVGADAFRDFTGGTSVAVGTNAGRRKVSGSYNLYLGYGVGDDATNVESNTVRIGHSFLYTRFFAGGIRGVTTGLNDAVTVMIDSAGQLGTVNSSRRYKDDIQDMGDASSGLMRLRPVTYRYTQAYADGSHPIDYGLIAEEVEQVYPDLVVHLANGDVETVQYHKINAMLLNEVQKQYRRNGEQDVVIAAQRRDLEDLRARLASLERLLAAAAPISPR